MRDLSEILGRQTLDLPINGKVYKVPEVDAETGLLIQKLISISVRADQSQRNGTADDGQPLVSDREAARIEVLIGDDDEEDTYQRILSPDVWDEMVADGVSWEQLKHCSMTVMVWVLQDRAAAENVWENGVSLGEAPSPNRAQRRAAARSGAVTRKASTSTAAASTTRRPASTSGTSSRAKKTASPGRRSSSTSA